MLLGVRDVQLILWRGDLGTNKPRTGIPLLPPEGVGYKRRLNQSGDAMGPNDTVGGIIFGRTQEESNYPFLRKRELSGSRIPGSVYSSSQASESERLIKQTYSVHVSLPVDRPRGIIRKWHLSEEFD